MIPVYKPKKYKAKSTKLPLKKQLTFTTIKVTRVKAKKVTFKKL